MQTTSEAFTAAQAGVTPLSGIWVNQLHSRLTISHDLTGALGGTYMTAVGELAGTDHPLVGFCDQGGPGGGILLGFVVRWPEDHSVTAWSGHYDPASDEINAMWLLTAAGDPCRDWKSTHIGHDSFRRSGLIDKSAGAVRQGSHVERGQQ